MLCRAQFGSLSSSILSPSISLEEVLCVNNLLSIYRLQTTQTKCLPALRSEVQWRFHGLHGCSSGGPGENPFFYDYFSCWSFSKFLDPWPFPSSLKPATWSEEFSNSCLSGLFRLPLLLVSAVGPSGQSLLISYLTACHGGLVIEVRRGQVLWFGYDLGVTSYDGSLASSVNSETRLDC